jgi:hypothetical protein
MNYGLVIFPMRADCLRKFLGAIAAIAPKMSILQHILDVAKAPKSCIEE